MENPEEVDKPVMELKINGGKWTVNGKEIPEMTFAEKSFLAEFIVSEKISREEAKTTLKNSQ
jgi:hypothetical protein